MCRYVEYTIYYLNDMTTGSYYCCNWEIDCHNKSAEILPIALWTVSYLSVCAFLKMCTPQKNWLNSGSRFDHKN